MKHDLNSQAILNKKFAEKAIGYDPEEVDTFLDLILDDYHKVDEEIGELNAQIIDLKRENEALKTSLREKDAQISLEKSKSIALSQIRENSLDNLELLQRCSLYEKKLYSLGVDPSKIK